MKILGIESAATTASVAIYDNDRILAEYTTDYKKTHSQTLLPMIAEIKQMISLDLESLDAIAISGGPGSFTGLRIGSTTAKGLGLALNKPLVNVPTLDAMAYQIFGTGKAICALLDARKGNVFTGIYRNDEEFTTLMEASHMSIEELAEAFDKLGQPVILTGDGADAYGEKLKALSHVPVSLAPVYARRARAAAVAALGAVYYEAGKTESSREHTPNYLRVSQAERQMADAGIKI